MINLPIRSLVALLLTPGCMLVLACAPRSTADMILTGGTVITLDKYNPPAQALAIVDGRILAVGRDDEIQRLAGLTTKRIDLKGAVVLPGLTDSHFHLVSFGRSLNELQLAGTKSAEEITRLVAAQARDLPPGTWITGRGWDQNDWEVTNFPTRGTLDKVTPNHPVYLRRVDGHAVWVNTKVLLLAGVTNNTPTPSGGAIHRDTGGHPTGIFVDNAIELVSRVMSKPSREDIRRWLLDAVQRCNEVGLTEVHDAGVNDLTLSIIMELADEGLLSLRYYGMLDGDDAELLERHFQARPTLNYASRVTVRAVKFYADGALGSRGAALLADYSDDPGNRGLMVTPPDQLQTLIAATFNAGFQPAVHAIGDRGNRMALDAYEAALAPWPGYDFRPRIEHAQVIALSDIPRFAKLGVIAAMQPTHATSDMYWAKDRL
ncbi:MAG: amidohydrolase, partial [Candidatus Neomarinimicrobiota bacterium]